MRLHVQPSDSFASAREIEVDDAAGASVEALVAAVAAALSAGVTEVFVWDGDFEEYALLEDIGDLADVLEAAGSAKVQVTVSAAGGGGASSPKPAAASSLVDREELADILNASDDSDLSDDDDGAAPSLAQAMAPAPKPKPATPRKPAPKPKPAGSPRPAPKPAGSPRPAAPKPGTPRSAAPKPAAKPAPKPAPKPAATPPPSSPPLDGPPPAGEAPRPAPQPAPRPAAKAASNTAPAPAAAPVRPVLASTAPPPSPAKAPAPQKSEAQDPQRQFGLVNPEELRAVLGSGPDDSSALGMDASAIVDKERLHRKKTAAGSQVVMVEPKSAIGQHLTEPSTKRDAGIPTCMEVRTRWIVIGMSHGTVLVFNHFGGVEQTVDLKITQPVTSVDVGIPSEEFMVAGYGDGTFVLWDLDNEKILKVVDGSKRGSPHDAQVIVSHFLPGTPTVITIDTTGKVNKTLFSNQRIRWSNKTEEIFDGSLGRFTAAQVLPPSAAREPTNHKFLTALSSQDAVFVMTLEPTVKQCFKQKRPPGVRDGALPYVCWRPDLRRGKNAFKQNSDPMLVIAWGNQVLLLQVMLSWLMMEDDPDDAEIKLIPKGSYQSSGEIQLITWLNPQVFVFVDDEWNMYVFDPSRLEVMETREITRLGLVSHAYFKSEGGTVDDESSFHHSITLCDEKVYMLGREQVHTCRVYKWTERLDLLVEQNQWEEALSLGLDFFEGTAKAAEGLPTDAEGLHRMVGDHMSEIVETFLDTMFRTAPDSAGEAEAHYRKACGVCIDYSIYIAREEMLFDEIYSKFCEAGHQGVFLELLEPFMLTDNLRQLAPEVLQAFVEHYQARGWLSRVEQCLTHMDVTVIDFDQVTKLCKEHELWSGLIYIFNAGFGDFVGPAEQLLKAIRESQGTVQTQALSTRLLRYVHDCFTRSGECKRVAVYDYATAMNSLRTHLFAPAAADAKQTVLFTLMQLNMGGALAVIAPVFDGRCTQLEQSYAEEVKRHREHERMEALDRGLDPPVHNDPVATPGQACFDTFLGLVIDGTVDALSGRGDLEALVQAGDFTREDLLMFYEAIAKWCCYRDPDELSQANGADSPREVLLPRDIGYRLMMFLICAPVSDNMSPHQRGTLLDQLLRCPKVEPFDDDTVLAQLERLEASGDAQIQLGLACSYLYERLGRYDKLVESMLKTTGDSAEVFKYLETLLETDGGSDGEERKEGVRKAFMQHMREFVTMDSKAAAALIVRHFGEHCVPLVKQLSDDPQTQFNFMDALITADIAEKGSSSKSGGLPSDLHELYLSLLCEFKPAEVKLYLTRTESYRLEYCLDLCRKHSVVDATAYLLERMGNPAGALELMLSLLPQKLQLFLEAAENARRTVAATYFASSQEAEAKVQQQLTEAAGPMQLMLSEAISLCENNTSIGQSAPENEGLWFALLDTFGEQQKAMETKLPRASSSRNLEISRTQSSQSTDVAGMAHRQLFKLLQQILESMMLAGNVSLRIVLAKIFEDFSDMLLSDMIKMITGLLEQYTQEAEVLEIAQKLQNEPAETHALYRSLARGTCVPSAAAAPTVRPKCCISGTPLHGQAAVDVVAYPGAVSQRQLEASGCCVKADSGAATHVEYEHLLSAGIRKRRLASLSSGVPSGPHTRPFPGRTPPGSRTSANAPQTSNLTAKMQKLDDGILPEGARGQARALAKRRARAARAARGREGADEPEAVDEDVEEEETQASAVGAGTDYLGLLREVQSMQEDPNPPWQRRVPVSARPPAPAPARQGTEAPALQRVFVEMEPGQLEGLLAQ